MKAEELNNHVIMFMINHISDFNACSCTIVHLKREEIFYKTAVEGIKLFGREQDGRMIAVLAQSQATLVSNLTMATTGGPPEPSPSPRRARRMISAVSCRTSGAINTGSDAATCSTTAFSLSCSAF